MSTYPYLWDKHLADILVRAGFTGDGYLRAFGTIQGESAGDPYCTNPNSDSSDKPAQRWWEGGKPWDAGLCQWNVYWQLSDPDNKLFASPSSPFFLADRETAIRKAYDPIWSAEALFAYTEGGVKNWNTWLAYRDGYWDDAEFMERAAAALEKVVAGIPTYKVHTVGGHSAIRAGSIPARCNPVMSWSRFFRLNPVVMMRDASGKKVRTEVTQDLMVLPGTDVRVGYTTTRLAAGPTVTAGGGAVVR